MDITGIIIAASIPSAFTAFCFWLLERKIQVKEDQRRAEAEKREKQRTQYEVCQLNMTVASMALAEATAKAVQRIPDAHCNGDMSTALEYAEKIKGEQKDFLRKLAIDNLDF
jgi:hypothetical protein